ncbi:DUF1353 domain-containing protein [Methylobacter sp. YRD-M1]|uniref:DUF1353 domain-containing protein n=1 Tax=Methylobacter sp. YRD-M1 TaxID=2911520 RepID=UPI00227BE8F4|nr:DUF1353 domain-containing protein [Methylobacter sp. YRD-M1]WAK04591.1 DUF1353 domain-containing protein [Methylobacter sp. YRD-M1]
MEDLKVVPVLKPDKNKLEEAYEIYEDVEEEVDGIQVKVPKLFQYDGASIPALGWQLIGTPFNPRFMRAAVFHDWLYHTHQFNRNSADELFYKILIRSGVNKTKAILMREAVENFGGWYWENDSDDLKYIQRLAKAIQDSGRDPADYGIP